MTPEIEYAGSLMFSNTKGISFAHVILFLDCVGLFSREQSSYDFINAGLPFRHLDIKVALFLNPLNLNAREQLVIDGLEEINPVQIALAQRLVSFGIHIAPGVSSMRSLDGVLEEELGNLQQAETRYLEALSLQSTDRLALIRMISIQLQRKDYNSAVKTADIIFRRWDGYSSIEPFLPAILSDKKGFEAAAETFSVSPAISNRIITILSNNPETIGFASQLLRKWKSESQEFDWILVSRVINNFIYNGNAFGANLLFRAMLPENLQSEAKYVFNGQFNLDFSDHLFDWKIKKQAGVSQSIVGDNETKDTTTSEKRHLELRFLDSPLQYNGPSQILALAPGKYKFRIEYSTENLKTPKTIRANIRCFKRKTVLASMDLEPQIIGDYSSQVEFSVAKEGCSLQELYFDNEFIAKSWRNRYSGILNIHSANIELLGG